MNQYRKVAVGGTFDTLHRGHKALLDRAFEVGENVVIGLTSDAFVADMHKLHKTAPYSQRCRELSAFLDGLGFAGRFEIVPLKDSFGLTISGKGLDALVVSKETEKTGQIINGKRADAGLPPLAIVVVDMVPAENHVPISTTRIRKKEIDRDGHLLSNRL
jgi:pantetheine-phosphate adenylyltransferase